MAFPENPFAARMSERTTSDHEFVRLFSPKILEQLPENAFASGVHVFSSPPGGGKTTIFRALTPPSLKAFWRNRASKALEEAYLRLLARGVFDEEQGPRLLGVMMSCASGFSDLPTGINYADEGSFRALLNCRVVLRTIKSLMVFLGLDDLNDLANITLSYDQVTEPTKHIPRAKTALELLNWAESEEQLVYATLDSLAVTSQRELPSHARFESVSWLEKVQFVKDGKPIDVGRMLLIDDLHKLTSAQRQLLQTELTDLRPNVSIWLAKRSIALGQEVLVQGAREGREISELPLDELWKQGKGPSQFTTFAENILDRRMARQNLIASSSFSSHLEEGIDEKHAVAIATKGVDAYREHVSRLRNSPRYREWLQTADSLGRQPTLEAIRRLYLARILISRDERKTQGSFDFPLPAEDLELEDGGKDELAAELFMHAELGVPYYFGFSRLCSMATNNPEELLTLAAGLFDGMRAKQLLRKDPVLSPDQQEKLLKEVADKRLAFFPKTHTEGTRARNLLLGIGEFAREKTYLPNAPYAPGVTGVRLSTSRLGQLLGTGVVPEFRRLVRVLSECIAENLLVTRQSAASAGREGGTVLYLNRSLCACFDLPLQHGGWQEVQLETLVGWMQKGPNVTRKQALAL